MSTVKSKKIQLGSDATASNNFTIYQPATPDGTLRIGVGNADSPTEVARFDATGIISGYPDTTPDALSTATGSAPSYSARAWVSFKGTGTVSIRDSGNVSSITDLGVGYYQVNFATAMSDANYSVTATIGGGSATFPSTPHIHESSYNVRYAPTTSSFRFRVYVWNNAAAFVDMPDNGVQIFR